MKLTGWSFTLEDENEREITIWGKPYQGSYSQWGATPWGTVKELRCTVSLCEQVIQQAEADGLLKEEGD